MSKTIVGVLEVAAIVGLQFVPGLGQAVAATIGLTGTAAAAQGLTIATLAVAATEYGINALLAPTIKPEQTETAIKTAIPPRITAYGISKLYGAYLLYTTSLSGVAIDVYAIHDGRIDGVITFYLGDIGVASGRGVLGGLGDGAYSGGAVEIDYRLGLPTETAFSQVVALDHSWSAAHRGDGIATAMVTWQPVKSKDYTKVYPNGQPALAMAARWSCIYDWRDSAQSLTDPSTWKWSANPVLHLADYLLRFDHKTWAKHFAPTLAYWTAAADDADSPSPVGGVQTTLVAPSRRGDSTIAIHSANGLVVGSTVYIDVSGDTNQTETRTVTSLSGPVDNTTVGLNASLSYNHPAGSSARWQGTNATEPRYRGCVAFKHTDAAKDVKTALLACFDGYLSPRADGALVVFSGRYQAPTVTIGPDEVVSYTLQDGVEEEAFLNSIAVTYVSENHLYNTVDTTPWTDDEDIASRGKVLATTLSNQVPSFSQARRLAKRIMAKNNAPKRGSVTTNSAGRIARGQRYIHLQLIDAGTTFYDGPAEITKLTRNLATGGVTFDWVLADPLVDEWTPATEEGTPAPVGNQVAQPPLDVPVITASSVDFGAQSGDGTSGAYLHLTATAPGRSDVTWFARTREVGASVWGERTYTDLPAGETVMLDSEFVPTDTMVEAEVAYQVGDGRVSDWSASVTADTHADSQAPDAATTPTLVSWTDTLRLIVDPIPRARSYRWRLYAADGTTFVASIDTPDRTLAYTAAQAAKDGQRRSYVVKVSGVNAAGEGAAVLSGALTNPAPAAVTTPAIAGGATTATATCDANGDPDLAGYVVFYSASSGFDPVTSGGVVTSGTPSIQIYGLAAGTYYGHIAAVDSWSSNPALLNLSAELPFTITTGGGSTPSGGGADGGGYVGQGGGPQKDVGG